MFRSTHLRPVAVRITTLQTIPEWSEWYFMLLSHRSQYMNTSAKNSGMSLRYWIRCIIVSASSPFALRVESALYRIYPADISLRISVRELWWESKTNVNVRNILSWPLYSNTWKSSDGMQWVVNNLHGMFSNRVNSRDVKVGERRFAIKRKKLNPEIQNRRKTFVSYT